MNNLRIADEIIRLIPRENLLSLVRHSAQGLGYYASPIFYPDVNLPAEIAIFAPVRPTEEDKDTGVRSLTQVATLVAVPLPPQMRIVVYCMALSHQQSAGLGLDTNYMPCEVSEGITEYLLRMTEGTERAEAWRAARVASQAQESSERDAGADGQTRPNASAFQGEPSHLITSRLLLQYSELVARLIALQERETRTSTRRAGDGDETEKPIEHRADAPPPVENAARANPVVSKRGKRGRLSKAEKLAALAEWDALDKDVYPIRLEEWLEAKFGAEAGVLNVAVSTFYGWRRLRESP